MKILNSKFVLTGSAMLLLLSRVTTWAGEFAPSPEQTTNMLLVGSLAIDTVIFERQRMITAMTNILVYKIYSPEALARWAQQPPSNAMGVTLLPCVLGPPGGLFWGGSIECNAYLRAMRSLGIMHAEEAVGPLMDRINWPYYQPHGMLGAFQGVNEAYVALVRIGKASSKAAIQRLAKCDNPKLRLLLVFVVEGVETKEVGAFMLKHAAETATDEAEKNNLIKALEVLESPHGPPPDRVLPRRDWDYKS